MAVVVWQITCGVPVWSWFRDISEIAGVWRKLRAQNHWNVGTSRSEPNPNPGTLNSNRRTPASPKVILILFCIHWACWIWCCRYMIGSDTSSCFSFFLGMKNDSLKPQSRWKSIDKFNCRSDIDRPEVWLRNTRFQPVFKSNRLSERYVNNPNSDSLRFDGGTG